MTGRPKRQATATAAVAAAPGAAGTLKPRGGVSKRGGATKRGRAEQPDGENSEAFRYYGFTRVGGAQVSTLKGKREPTWRKANRVAWQVFYGQLLRFEDAAGTGIEDIDLKGQKRGLPRIRGRWTTDTDLLERTKVMMDCRSPAGTAAARVRERKPIGNVDANFAEVVRPKHASRTARGGFHFGATFESRLKQQPTQERQVCEVYVGVAQDSPDWPPATGDKALAGKKAEAGKKTATGDKAAAGKKAGPGAKAASAGKKTAAAGKKAAAGDKAAAGNKATAAGKAATSTGRKAVAATGKKVLAASGTNARSAASGKKAARATGKKAAGTATSKKAGATSKVASASSKKAGVRKKQPAAGVRKKAAATRR